MLPFLFQLRKRRILPVLQQREIRKAFVNTILGLIKLIKTTPLAQIDTIANGHMPRTSSSKKIVFNVAFGKLSALTHLP